MNRPEIARVARHAIEVFRDYTAAGVAENVAQAAAIGETVDALKDEPDLLPRTATNAPGSVVGLPGLRDGRGR